MQRRDFLKYMLSSSVAGSAWFANGMLGIATAHAATAPKSLIVIFQRGGCDGLNVAVPYGDAAYYSLRPTIAIPRAGQAGGALDLNGFFGLHPAMTALHKLYQQGNVAVFPAVHYPNASLSHFDSEQFIESGMISKSSNGWLNRHLEATSNSSGMRGVSFGTGIDQALRGNVSVSSFNDLAAFDLDMAVTAEQRMTTRLQKIYAQNPHLGGSNGVRIQNAGRTLFADLALVQQLDVKGYAPANGAVYPANTFGTQLRQAAQLVKSGVGLELATVNLGGWDTHNAQGNQVGYQANMLKIFADGIAALYTDLGTAMQDVMILTMTEFGRTAEENGSQGTDHGNAACWFALGGGVRSGIYGQWPGLSKTQLYKGRYLAQSVDFRDIFGEIASKHLHNNGLASLLPGHNHTPLNFLA
jgi:uncharacterized protein (DUF1501 family)